MGKKAKIDFLPGHPADVLAMCADIGKAAFEFTFLKSGSFLTPGPAIGF